MRQRKKKGKLFCDNPMSSSKIFEEIERNRCPTCSYFLLLLLAFFLLYLLEERNETTASSIEVSISLLDEKKSIDPYKVLGVDKPAIQRDIQEAFQELSFKYHPYVNKEKGAKEKFDQICDAYRILSERYGDVMSDTNSGGGSYGDHGAFNVVVSV